MRFRLTEALSVAVLRNTNLEGREFRLSDRRLGDALAGVFYEGSRPDQLTLFIHYDRLDAIKDHIASSLAIEQDDLEEVPFNTIGGLGRAYELFGDRLAPILDELNMRLAA